MPGSLISQPFVTFNLATAQQDVANTAQRILFLGDMDSGSGTSTPGDLEESIGNAGEEEGLFGIKSMLAAQLRNAKKIAPTVAMDAIGLVTTGAASVKTVAFAGTATAAGSYEVIIGGKREFTVTVTVASGDTATAVGASLVVAFGTVPRNAYATAVNTTGSVAFTASDDGYVSDNLPIEVLGTVAGLTHTVVITTPGTGLPTLTSVLDVTGERRYQAIVWPWYDDLSVLKTFLDARFNVDNDVQDGVGFTAAVDDFATIAAALDALNSQSIVQFSDKLETAASYKGPAMPEASYVVASQFAATRALRLTPNASVANFVLTNAALDQFGGTALASLPYFNTSFPFLSVIPASRGWTQAEIELFTDTHGGSVIGQNVNGTNVIGGEVVTTYKTDPAANPDLTWKFLNYVDTSSNIREYYVNNVRSRFGQTRLTTGSLTRGRDMANQASIEAYLDKLYLDLAGVDFILTQDGEVAIAFFKTNRIVSLNIITGTVTIQMLVPIVTQFRNALATINITFDTTG